MTSYTPQLIKYVNWSITRLSTHSTLDYSDKYLIPESNSRLVKEIESASDSLDQPIQTICSELNSDVVFTNKVKQILEIIESPDDVEQLDQVLDELYEKQYELFEHVNNFIGLNAIKCLHQDSRNKFESKFCLLLGFCV